MWGEGVRGVGLEADGVSGVTGVTGRESSSSRHLGPKQLFNHNMAQTRSASPPVLFTRCLLRTLQRSSGPPGFVAGTLSN